MAGSMVTLTASDGGQFEAYLSEPANGSGPGLVLLQEIFGINPFLRNMADQFASEGYVTLVPDLFWRMKPGIVLGYDDESLKQAFDYYGRFDVDLGIKDAAASIDALRAMAQCSGKVGALGYCLGGKLAYLTATRTDADCCICYYGVGIEESLDEISNISCPMVLHFAENDSFVPPQAVEQIRQAFSSFDDVEIYSYPDLDHAFATPGRDSYHEQAAEMAYARSIDMLRKSISPAAG